MRLILLIFTFCSLNVFCQPEINETRLKTLVKDAEVVALVEITDVQPSPGFWSGQFPAIQNVNYKVLEVFKGTLPSDVISHGFYVIKNAPLSDRQKPQLSPLLFARQKRQVLFLKSKSTAKEPANSSTVDRTAQTNSLFEIGHVLLADRKTLKELKQVL